MCVRECGRGGVIGSRDVYAERGKVKYRYTQRDRILLKRSPGWVDRWGESEAEGDRHTVKQSEEKRTQKRPDDRK